MKIIRLWSPPRRPVEPTSANCVAGHPVNSQESTLLRPVFAGFQRRVRKTTGLCRAVAAGLAVGMALLVLTGCMVAASKADVDDVIVIAATATANEPAPPCPRPTSRSCKRPASRARPPSRSSSIRPTASQPSFRLPPAGQTGRSSTAHGGPSSWSRTSPGSSRRSAPRPPRGPSIC